MEENRLNFFGDFSERIVSIAIGLLSVYTVLPMFIDNLAEIFHIDILTGYCIFVFLYFIFPLIFYLLYCSIHDYVGFLKLLPQPVYKNLQTKKWYIQGSIETLLIILATVFLLFPDYIITCAGIIILIGLTVSVFIHHWVTYNKAFRFEGMGYLRGDVKEFRIITCVVLFIFLVFFAFNRNDIAKSFNQFSIADIDTTIDNYYYKDAIKKVVDETAKRKEYYYTRSMQLFSQNPDEALKSKKIPITYLDCFSGLANTLHKIEKDPLPDFNNENFQTIKNTYQNIDYNLQSQKMPDTSLIYKVYEMSYYANEYAKKISEDKTAAIKTSWKNMIRNLQYKALIWQLTLIILGLCLWLQMQDEYMFRLKKEGKDAEEKFVKQKDNINQIKSFIYTSFLLILPFFRVINESDIDLNKPFLNTNIQQIINTPSEEINSPKIDLSELEAMIYQTQRQITDFSVQETNHYNYLDTQIKKSIDEVGEVKVGDKNE